MKCPAPILASALLFAGHAAASAAAQPGPVYTVTTLTDRNNSTAQEGDCSLREAIRAATAANRASSIIFAASLNGTITLSASLGELKLTTPVSILGPGARTLAIAAPAGTRVLNASGGPHLISGLALRNGTGASNLDNGQTGGGAILNSGTLALKECALTNNQATSDSRYHAYGGAIYNLGGGVLSLVRCTLSGNKATGGTSSINRGRDGLGGAVYNAGAMQADHCTFYSNTGTGGTSSLSGYPNGQACGAIFNSGGSVTLRSCTINNNTGTGAPRNINDPDGDKASYGVGAVFNFSGSISVQNTIIAGNTSVGYPATRDVRGNFTSQGNNLIGARTADYSDGNSSGFSHATDQTGTDSSRKDPMLGSFQANNGVTDNLMPSLNSPAVDNGKQEAADWVDQRGLLRRYDVRTVQNKTGDGTDIGAVEYYPTGTSGTPGVVSFLGGAARVLGKGDPGVVYKLQWSTDLMIFNDFPGSITATADGKGVLEWTDPDATPGRRLYRGIKSP